MFIQQFQALKELLLLKYSTLLFNDSPGPSGGLDCKTNEISLSNAMRWTCGAKYFFFVSINIIFCPKPLKEF